MQPRSLVAVRDDDDDTKYRQHTHTHYENMIHPTYTHKHKPSNALSLSQRAQVWFMTALRRKRREVTFTHQSKVMRGTAVSSFRFGFVNPAFCLQEKARQLLGGVTIKSRQSYTSKIQWFLLNRISTLLINSLPDPFVGSSGWGCFMWRMRWVGILEAYSAVLA